MIIRRYKRYQRDIIRTKVKEFFESYVKWLKAFNLKQKYIRSANIGNTCLKNRQRKNQLRGGRKRKCSFRKTGPFMYGKPLYKRNSLQRTSHLRRAFNIFTSSSQNSLNKAITSTQQTVTKTGKIARDAANNIWDLLRLRRFPRPTLIAVFPFLGSSVENEFSRVATYANFPTRTPVSTLRLARAGFFYTGSSDLVECFHCHVQHGNWETNDIPFEIHERISPSCDFILGNDTANTAIDRSSIQSGPHTSLLSTTSLAQSRNCETNMYGTLTSGELQTNSSAYASIGSERSSALLSTGSECYEELHSDSIGFSNQCTENSLSTIDQEESGSFHQISTTASQTCSFENREHSMNRNANGISSVVDKSKIHNKPTHSDCTRMGKMTNTQPRHHAATVQLKPLNQCHDRPKYIAYAVITVRMSTFKGWSSHTSQTPRELATAGLFYTGCGDLVRCWFCGISLQSWETNDDPWIEHAKWAPACLFLRRSKGDEFIQLVHERNNFCSHSNSTRNVEEPSMSPIQNAPEEIQTPLHLAATVERVKAMGYSTGLIQKAIETLQRDNTPIDTNSIVNELIENERSYFSNKPDRVKVSELAWNTAARTSEVASCSNGLTEGMRNLDIQESNRLMEENRRLRQELKCKICMDVDAVITFVPCGHMICCEDCGYAVSKCPVCRRAIETRVKTWMS
ncbi:E3 ubiquitin-protein ligase XIAP [Mizuhopecten yessoensis]|uniref:E3 ubiquitin-protein ligase XIAP n=2 Tax=Mizuhopecten yessoensis TaxID=6573 RepID=A0A210QB40_MIZYE|nr:E3 ubiquitin-protein ligase XIAP [Mizuhopecten yessoensis]